MNNMNSLLIAALLISSAYAVIESLPSLKGMNMEDDIAAMVNDNQIKTVDYLTAVTMMKEDKRNQMNAADHQLIIDRLIEEELLFQHGLNNGIIYQTDISKKIIDNMLLNIFSDITSVEISDEFVEEFYLTQMKTNTRFRQAMVNQPFNSIKVELKQALLEIEKSRSIREYIAILKQKADIQYDASSELAKQTAALRATL